MAALKTFKGTGSLTEFVEEFNKVVSALNSAKVTNTGKIVGIAPVLSLVENGGSYSLQLNLNDLGADDEPTEAEEAQTGGGLGLPDPGAYSAEQGLYVRKVTNVGGGVWEDVAGNVAVMVAAAGSPRNGWVVDYIRIVDATAY